MKLRVCMAGAFLYFIVIPDYDFLFFLKKKKTQIKYGDQLRALHESHGAEGTLLRDVVESLGKGRDRLRRVISSGGLRSILWEQVEGDDNGNDERESIEYDGHDGETYDGGNDSMPGSIFSMLTGRSG
jgi:hypothetical protein